MPGISRRMSGFAKKALLIGVEYHSSLGEHGQTLPGAHKDPFCLRDLLIGMLGHFNLHMLTLIQPHPFCREVWL